MQNDTIEFTERSFNKYKIYAYNHSLIASVGVSPRGVVMRELDVVVGEYSGNVVYFTRVRCIVSAEVLLYEKLLPPTIYTFPPA
jgi:hypothetical protein